MVTVRFISIIVANTVTFMYFTTGTRLYAHLYVEPLGRYRSVLISLAWIRTLVTVYFTVPYLQFNHTGSVFSWELYQQETFDVNFNEAYLILKWTKIGSRILIIDVLFKFSNFYFDSPDPSSDPRRRLRKFKSGFQFFFVFY